MQYAGQIAHVSARGVGSIRIFLDRLDYVRHLEILAKCVRRHRWVCLGYCLMGTHFHVLLRLREPTLSAGMQLLNGLYARRFNERYGGSGHVFRRRFHHQTVERETHLFETLRYLPLNPVRAGLCADPAEWEWSSFAATAGLVRPPWFLSVREVRALFGTPDAVGAARYAEFVRDGIGSRREID